MSSNSLGEETREGAVAQKRCPARTCGEQKVRRPVREPGSTVRGGPGAAAPTHGGKSLQP